MRDPSELQPSTVVIEENEAPSSSIHDSSCAGDDSGPPKGSPVVNSSSLGGSDGTTWRKR